VRGTVPSMEDKLTISRKMRQVSGCSAAVNLVIVTAVEHDGRVVTQAAADGSPALDAGPKLARVNPQVARVPTPQLTTATAKHPEADAIVTPALGEGGTAARPSKVAAPPAPVVKSDAVPFTSGATPTAAPLLLAKATTYAPDAGPAPSGWAEKPAAAQTIPTPATATPAKPILVVLSPVPNPPNGRQLAGAFVEKPVHAAYVTTGTVVLDDDPTEAPLSRRPPPAQTMRPVTPAPVLVSAMTGDPFAPLPTSESPKLKRQVETICGKQARDVQVQLKADKMIHVLVKVDDVKTQQALTDRILTQVPEMATPNVRLEMVVAEPK
jgi:hypothetical protein